MQVSVLRRAHIRLLRTVPWTQLGASICLNLVLTVSPLVLVSTGGWVVFGACQNMLGQGHLWQYKFSGSLLTQKGQLVSISKGRRTCKTCCGSCELNSVYQQQHDNKRKIVPCVKSNHNLMALQIALFSLKLFQRLPWKFVIQLKFCIFSASCSQLQ